MTGYRSSRKQHVRRRNRQIRTVGSFLLALVISLMLPTIIASVVASAATGVYTIATAVIMGNCCQCQSGKWIAAQAYVNWHGNEPFTSEVGCPPHPDCPANPIMGGTKYLKRKSEAQQVWSCISADWVRQDGGWVLHSNTVGLNAHVINETVVNPRSGCITLGSQTHVNNFTHGEFGDGCGCSGTSPPPFFFMLDTISCTVGGGTISESPIDVWIHGFGYACGQYIGDTGGCGGGFPGGSAADLAAYLFGMTVTFDPVTATGIGVHGTFAFHHTGTYDAGTMPPADNDGSPWSDDAIFCASVDATSTFDATVTLSDEHDYAALFGLATELLGTYDFTRENWHEELPQDDCFEGGFIAFAGSTLIPLLHFNDIGCCASGGTANGNGVDCLPFDDSVIRTYVQGVGDGFAQLRWGAFIEYGPIGDTGGAIIVQKWAMREGCYLAHDWQDDAAKTWRYLLQEWTANFCTAAATYSCGEGTGSRDLVICISPNFEYPTCTFNTTFIPERTVGNIWQSVYKDADADKYPADGYTAPANSDPVCYIEPESCGVNCPTADVCGPPGLGQCPFIAPDNCDTGC